MVPRRQSREVTEVTSVSSGSHAKHVLKFFLISSTSQISFWSHIFMSRSCGKTGRGADRPASVVDSLLGSMMRWPGGLRNVAERSRSSVKSRVKVVWIFIRYRSMQFRQLERRNRTFQFYNKTWLWFESRKGKKTDSGVYSSSAFVSTTLRIKCEMSPYLTTVPVPPASSSTVATAVLRHIPTTTPSFVLNPLLLTSVRTSVPIHPAWLTTSTLYGSSLVGRSLRLWRRVSHHLAARA